MYHQFCMLIYQKILNQISALHTGQRERICQYLSGINWTTIVNRPVAYCSQTGGKILHLVEPVCLSSLWVWLWDTCCGFQTYVNTQGPLRPAIYSQTCKYIKHQRSTAVWLYTLPLATYRVFIIFCKVQLTGSAAFADGWRS